MLLLTRPQRQLSRSTFVLACLVVAAAMAAPQIEVLGNGSVIVDGDSSPELGDGSDFGTVHVGDAGTAQTFVVRNVGDAPLALIGPFPVTFSGVEATEFSVSGAPAATIPAGDSTTLTVTFTPLAPGLRTATVSIASDDPDHNPYTFAIQGTGSFVAEGELPVRQGLLMQLDAGTLAGYADGDPVPLWPDRSGNGHDAAPVGANGTPLYASAAIGGRPAVRLDGVDNNLVVGTVRDALGGLDLFLVAAGPTATGGTWQRLVSAWSGIAGKNDWTYPSWQISRPNTDGAADIFPPQVFRIGYSADYEIDHLTFGALSQNVTANNLAGDLAEAVLFDRLLTSAERSKVGAYLQRKYGITPTYTHPGTATVSATGVSGLSTTGATINGMLDSSGNSPTEVRLYYGPSDGGSTATSWATMAVVAAEQSGMGLPQSIALTGLTPDTTYYARFAGANLAGLSFSATALTFRTALPTVSVGDCSVFEGGSDPVATFTVFLSQPWGSDFSIPYTTVDGTAMAGADYTACSGNLLFPAETVSGTLTVPILLDSLSELPEQFTLEVDDSSGTCTIRDVYRDYYVSLTGNDANPGTIDQPFATMGQARDALATVYGLGLEPAGGITVWLRGGRYELPATVVFDAAAGGTAVAPITYQGYPGEEVRLSGGRQLQPAWFSLVTAVDAVWSRLDSAAQGEVYQIDLNANGIAGFGTLRRRGFGKDGPLGALELFVNDRPQQLARWPNSEGFTDVVVALSTTQFTYSGTRPERWATAEEPWAHGYWYEMWADEHLPIGSIDTAAHTITLGGEHNYGIRAGQPYYVYNLLEEIDLPGEWYLNRATGILYYWPDTPLAAAELEVSLLDTPLIQLTGTSHLRFADLLLECTRGELARIDNGTDNRFERCTFRNCGTNAVVVSGTVNGVDACTISETGSGGVKLNGGDRKTLTEAGNFVTNCEIHHYGRWCWTYAPAVRPNGCGFIVEHNHIWHAPHTAILFNGNRNSVKYNHIHDVCRFSSDAGAIYTGRDWGARGNEVSHNFIHDIDSTFVGWGVHGIYVDDLASGVTVHGNILYEITGYGVQHGGGRDDIFTNNVFKNCGYGDRADCRGIGWAYASINDRAQDSMDLLYKLRLLDYRSVIWTAAFPECAAIPDDYDLAYTKANGWLTPGGSVLARNVYCNVTNGLQYSTDNAFSYYATIADNREVCDPLFVDEANLNLTIDPASTALLVPGFETIPFAQIGPLREIDLQGNGTSIASGDTTPSSADHTDLGEAAIGDAPVIRTFTIANSGGVALSLSGTPSVSGTNAAEFAVVAEPSATVAAGAATTFQVAFSPNATGLRSAVLTIRSDDIDEGTYTFAIQGTGKWRSSLYPADWTPATTDGSGRFLHDFSYAGYHGGTEPLPASPPGPMVDATQAPYLADPTGSVDSTAAIQQALDAVGEGGGGVVYLPPGTYLISLPASQKWALRIRYPRTVLRGAGRDKTFVECTSTTITSANIILVQPDLGNVYTPLAGTTHLLAADADNRASTVELVDAAGLQVGDRVVLRSDWTQEFIDEHGMAGVWTPSSSVRSGLYMRRIVAISGTTVTLDTPIRYPLKTRDNACLYLCAPFLREVGIEDLAIGNRQNPGSGWAEEDYSVVGTGAYEVHGSHFVRFSHVWDGWMTRVSTYRPASNTLNVHVLSNAAIVYASRFVTFADCVVARSQYEGGGGNGYGLSFQDANDCLFTGCEAIHMRHNYDFKCAGSNGNVVHRSAGRTPKYASDFHMYLSIGNLFDCMTMDGDFLECRYRPYGSGSNLHGHAGTQNVFWNTYGTAARSDKVVESRQFGDGYVIGTSGPTNTVVLTPLDGVSTAPIDWSEGIGTGDTLYPESLYESQLARRSDLFPHVEDAPLAATHTAATLHATVMGTTGQAILYWGSTDGGMLPDAWEHQLALGEVTAGPLVAELSDLSPVTTYCYRWLVWNESGEDWADATGTFTTLLGPVIQPTGATLASTSSGTFTAELQGVDAQVVLYWGATDGGTDPAAWDHAVGPSAQSVGSFGVALTGLPSATVVHYRWWASGNSAESWSVVGTVDTTPELTVGDVSVAEGAGTAVFTVAIQPPSSVEATVEIATQDGTALAGADYAGLATTVTIPAGEASATFAVTLLDDYTVETYRKEFQVLLASPVNAKLGTTAAAGTILDDDLPPMPVTAGLVLHLDASSLQGILAEGETTTTWPDLSGLGHDAVTDAGSPEWHERGIGGRPAFAFDGVSNTFVTASIRAEDGAVSVYIISEKDAADGGAYQRVAASNSVAASDWTLPNWALNGYPAGAVGGAPAAYPARLDSPRYNSGRGIGPLRLARQGSAVGGWFRGDIGEVLVYDRYLTDAEHALVGSWLKAKYAVSGFTVAPYLAVSGLDQPILKGDVVPDAADGTDFGETPESHVFVIHNPGTDGLTIASVAQDSPHFTISSPPGTTNLAPGQSTTFILAFAPAVRGTHAATVTITSNASGQSPYTFAVTGDSVGPQVQVEEAAAELASGDGLDFGSVVLGAAAPSHTLTVTNVGNRDLVLLSASLDGSSAFAVAGFVADTTLAPGASASLGLSFDPGTAGNHQATFSLASNDEQRTPFTLALTGAATLPVYSVRFQTDGTAGASLAGDASQQVTQGQNGSTVEALVPTGYRFVNWTMDGQDYSLANPLVVTGVAGDMTLVAHFTPQVYTWTFLPGLHGALASGEPEADLAATFGQPSPAPPAIQPDHGYTFTGWSESIPATVGVGARAFTAEYEQITYALTVVNGSGSGNYPEGAVVPVQADAVPVGRYFAGWTASHSSLLSMLGDMSAMATTFTMRDQAATLTATYGYVDPVWTVPLTVVGAAPSTLTIGMHLAATDGWDPDLDFACAAPGPGQACLAPTGLSLSTDLHAPAQTADFLLVAHAAEGTAATVSWDLAGLPAGKRLTLYEVRLDNPVPNHVGRTRIGHTAQDMAVVSSIEIPAGETRSYVLRYGSEQVYDLPLVRGWNLVSLPIEPVAPAVDAVLGAAAAPGRAVWTLADQRYVAVAEMHACAGYWVYAPESTVRLVAGTTVAPAGLALRAGWNICATTVPCRLPADPSIHGAILLWNAKELRYEVATDLLPGRAYLLDASDDAVVPLSPKR